MRFIKKAQYGNSSSNVVLTEGGEVIMKPDGSIVEVDGPFHDETEQIQLDGSVKKVKKGEGGVLQIADAVLSDTTNPNKDRSSKSDKQKPFKFSFKKGDEFAGLKIGKTKSGSPSQMFNYLKELRDKEVSKHKDIEYHSTDPISLSTQELNSDILNSLPSDEKLFEEMLILQERNKDISGEDFDDTVKAQYGGYNNWRNNLPLNLRDTTNYNLKEAYELGYIPELVDGEYHLPSRNEKTGKILKSKNHPTFNLAIEEDRKLGYLPYIDKNGAVFTFDTPPDSTKYKPFQYGGIPTNINGLYEESGPVIIPSNQITMNGINQEVIAIDPITGQVLDVMQPDQNYYFPETEEVLEIPIAQGGMSSNRFYENYLNRYASELDELERLEANRKVGYSGNSEQQKRYSELKDRHQKFLKDFNRNIRSNPSVQSPINNSLPKPTNISPVERTNVLSETEREMRMKNWVENAKENKKKGRKLSTFEKNLLSADKDARLTMVDQYERNLTQRAREIPATINKGNTLPSGPIRNIDITPSNRWNNILGKIGRGVGAVSGAVGSAQMAYEASQLINDTGYYPPSLGGHEGMFLDGQDLAIPTQNQQYIPARQVDSMGQIYNDAGLTDPNAFQNSNDWYANQRPSIVSNIPSTPTARQSVNAKQSTDSPELTMQDRLDALTPPARTFDAIPELRDIQPLERRTNLPDVQPIEREFVEKENPLAQQLQNRISNIRQEADSIIGRRDTPTDDKVRLGRINRNRGLAQINEAMNQLSRGVSPEYMSDAVNPRMLTPIEIDATPYLDEIDGSVSRALQNINTNTAQGSAIAGNLIVNANRQKRELLNRINSQNQNIRTQTQNQNNQIVSNAELRDDANRKDYFTRTQQSQAAYDTGRMSLANQIDRLYNERVSLDNMFTLENMRNPNYQIEPDGTVYRTRGPEWNILQKMLAETQKQKEQTTKARFGLDRFKKKK